MVFDNQLVIGAVEELFRAGVKVYSIATGAGAGITQRLWQVPGASTTLVGGAFPYDQNEFNLVIGKDWKKTGYGYCSQEAAMALALTAYFRCQQSCAAAGDHLSPIIGIGLTAAASTNRTLKGGTRCFAAVHTEYGTFTVEVQLEQGYLGRIGDGEVCDLIALNLLMFAAGLAQVPFAENLHITSAHLALTTNGLTLTPQPLPVINLPHDLRTGVIIMPNGELVSVEDFDFSKWLVFPGTFNPPHAAHHFIAVASEQDTELSVMFEITANTVDKAAQVDSLATRARQLMGRWPVIVRTGAALFKDKLLDYHGLKSFILGADTAIRVLDSKYYGGEAGLLAALEGFARQGVTFYVFSRQVNGNMISCKDLNVPAQFRHLFYQLPGRWDMSSTDIRTARKPQ